MPNKKVTETFLRLPLIPSILTDGQTDRQTDDAKNIPTPLYMYIHALSEMNYKYTKIDAITYINGLHLRHFHHVFSENQIAGSDDPSKDKSRNVIVIAIEIHSKKWVIPRHIAICITIWSTHPGLLSFRKKFNYTKMARNG